MSEYLDRKQVIDLYEKHHSHLATYVWEFGQELRQLPIVEERPHGEWIDEGVMADGCSQHAFRCPKCGNHISRIPSDMPNFCENCGAELETVGYWFPDWSESYGKDGFRCSMCYRWTSEKEEKCHHCGARMKECEKNEIH